MRKYETHLDDLVAAGEKVWNTPGRLGGSSVESVEPCDIVNESLDTIVLIVREHVETFAEFRQWLFHAVDVTRYPLRV